MTGFIKICGLTDEPAVMAAVEAGADAVGFVFAKSVREVTPQRAATLAARVPPGVRRVAVMLHPDAAQWQDVLQHFGPQVLQTDASDFDQIEVPDGIERWPVIREKNLADGDALPVTFLYEGGVSGSGETVDWTRAADVAARGRMILAGGLGPDNVAEAIRQVRPWGVDVSSAVESRPGRKDPAKIAAFVRAARDAFG